MTAGEHASLAPFSAVLLAAGFSRRMGRDKALLAAPEGALLWERQRRVLAEAGAAEIFLSARAEQSWAAAAAPQFSGLVHDAVADAGPLAGIAAALGVCSHPRLLVLAVDLPHMTPAYLRRLVAHAPDDATGVIPAWPDERTEPLCALYPRAAHERAVEALAQRRFTVHAFAAVLEAGGAMTRRPIAPADADLFFNWNAPEDR